MGLVTLVASPTLAGKRKPANATSESGVFEILQAGKPIGTETFEIRSSAENLEALAEIHLRVVQDGKTLEAKTYPDLVLDPQLRPLTYSWKQKGAQNSELHVDFQSSPAKIRYKTVNGQDDVRDFDLPKDVLILDDNVIHHYELAVRRYETTNGGKQSFGAFVPQEALPGILTVEEVAADPADPNTAKFKHLVVTTELAHVDLWVDDQQHLQRIVFPESQLEAIRKK